VLEDIRPGGMTTSGLMAQAYHILPQRHGHETRSHTSGSNRIALVGVQRLLVMLWPLGAEDADTVAETS
jgi:hypothetical protein